MDGKSALKTVFALLALASAMFIATTGAGAASKQKIVALTPFSANALAETGTRPVAIGQQALGHKHTSSKLKGVEQLPLSHPNGPNLETIAKIDPDVVLSSPGWAKGNKTMKDLAYTVRNLDPNSVSQTVPQIRAIGNAYGNKKKTTKLANAVTKEIKFATAAPGHKITKHPKVMLILGVGRSPNVFLSNTWGASVAKAAGANLLGQELKASGGFAKVSDEYIVAQDPDIIIAVPHGNAKDIPAIRDYLLNNPAWSTTRAVQTNSIYAVMDDSLLQPDVDVGDTIKRLRVKYLKNW
jgi:iron complex transport system substrate-binding protein